MPTVPASCGRGNPARLYTPHFLAHAPMLRAREGTEAWRLAWRIGFAPQFSAEALRAVADALRTDSPALLQGATVEPAPILSNGGLMPSCACPVGLMIVAEGARTVADVEQRFAKVCFEADKRLGEPTACRRFLNWFDDTPRDTVRRELLGEITAHIDANSTR